MADKILNGDMLINGDLSATNFYGDGSGLTGIGVNNMAVATPTQNGLMSAQDKQILNNLNPNISITVSNINSSEFHIINAKEENALGLVIAAEPIIESRIRTNNLLDASITFGNFYIGANGATNASTSDLLGDFIPVTPGDDIYFTGHVGETTASSVNRRLHVYRADKTWIKQISFAGSLRVGQDWSTHGVIPENGAYIRVSWGTTDINLMISVGAPIKYEPYYITPFDTITSVNFKIGPTSDPEDAISYNFNVPASAGDQYSFIFNPISGVLQSITGHISSYNGETLPGHWQSDRDEYSEGATPSIGAEVIYRLADEDIQEYQGTSMTIPLDYHTNYFFMENGFFQEIQYYAETVAMQHLTIYSGITFGESNIVEQDIKNWQNTYNSMDTKADINSPTFTGVPTTPTPGIYDYSTKIANTAYVQRQMENLATNETSTKATKNYSIGDYVYIRGKFCKVITAIVTGQTFTVGTNIEETTIGEQLQILMTAVFNN